jgi:DNA primase
MEISEQVLVSTLAQLLQKERSDIHKNNKQEQKTFEVVKNDPPAAVVKVDILNQLERKIIEILLLYGDKQEEFEDVLLKTNASGEVENVTEMKMSSVYQRVYLSLQEDEVELANPMFRGIYDNLIGYFNQNESFVIENYLMQLPLEFSQEVTDILMEDEKVFLHDWEGQNIIVKRKDQTIGQYVTETILTLRWFLVVRIIEELKSSISSEPNSDNTEPLSLAIEYYKLINTFSSKLGRVMSRYS